MSDNILDKLTSRARVRVYKPTPGFDDRNSLCGEPIQRGTDADSKPEEFFEIPAHQADYINRAFMSYRVSEPFIPGVDDTTTLELVDKEFVCQVEGCGRSFNTQAALAAHMRSHSRDK